MGTFSMPIESSKPAAESQEAPCFVPSTSMDPSVTDKQTYDAWVSGGHALYNQKFVSGVDPSRKNIREKNLHIERPETSTYRREYLRQARKLAVDRAAIQKPSDTPESFSGGWQDNFLTEMTTRQHLTDRDTAAARAGAVQRTERERELSFEQNRQRLQNEHELVRPHLKCNIGLRDMGYYQRSGMLQDNPHLHVADSVISWKQAVASRDAELKEATYFHETLVNRQRYLDAGLYGLTRELL